jgi:non-specific serine/threonine protein kinase
MASAASSDRYRFGQFELQLDERRLLKDGAAVALRPRAFDLLAVLVERPGHLLAKDELLERVWPKMVVEEAAIHVQVSALRKVLGPDAITTVSGQGHRFALPVTKAEAQASTRRNLPSHLTSFIGRHQEIAQLEELFTHAEPPRDANRCRWRRQDAACHGSSRHAAQRVCRWCLLG